jgi:predicted ATPase
MRRSSPKCCDGRYPALKLTPQQRRQKTLEALFAQVETFAWKGPVLIIFEDAHWSDPTSLDAFGRAADRIALIDQAEALGEPPKDPLLLSSVLLVPGSQP